MESKNNDDSATLSITCKKCMHHDSETIYDPEHNIKLHDEYITYDPCKNCGAFYFLVVTLSRDMAKPLQH